MKTINKKSQAAPKRPEKKSGHFFQDHPEGHELLSKSAREKRGGFIAGVIEVKKTRVKSSKSYASLISSISLCLSLLMIIWAFELKFQERTAVVDLSGNEGQFEDILDIPQTEQIQKPPVQVQIPKIIEVSNEEIVENIQIDLDIEMTQDTRIEEVIITQFAEVQDEKADEIFTIVEQQPQPSGGFKAFYDYVGANLSYPARASRMGIEGRVFVEFIVEKDGSLSDIRVVKGIGGGCDEEAIRVITGSPKWIPGKQRGNPVRVRMVMPIVFKLLA